jgi:hypothetical protein
MSKERNNRILKRNELIRAKFKKFADKRCYRIDYILEQISLETGLHTEYIRTIVKEVNITENRIRKENIQADLSDEKNT